MDDKADVRLVDTHAEGVRCNHDGLAVKLKIVLILLPLLICEARVIARGGDAAVTQAVAHALDRRARCTVDDAASASSLVNECGEGGKLVFRAAHVEIEVRTVEARHDAVRALQLQEPQDIRLHLLCRRRGVGRDNGSARQGIDEIDNAEVTRAEVLSPL